MTAGLTPNTYSRRMETAYVYKDPNGGRFWIDSEIAEPLDMFERNPDGILSVYGMSTSCEKCAYCMDGDCGDGFGICFVDPVPILTDYVRPACSRFRPDDEMPEAFPPLWKNGNVPWRINQETGDPERLTPDQYSKTIESKE